MKKITENELKNKVSRLREYLTVLEAGVASSAPPSPAGTVKNAAGGQTTTNAGGAATSVTRNSRPVDPAYQAAAAKIIDRENKDREAAAAAAQSTKPAWPTDKASIIAFQKANKLTADGMIGKKTMAALQASGAQPPAGFKPVGNKAAQSTKPAAPAPAPISNWVQRPTDAQMGITTQAAAAAPEAPAETTAAQAAVPYIGPSRAQQADMDASSQGPTPASDLANANAQDQQADMDASSQGALTKANPLDPSYPAYTAADQEDADMGKSMAEINRIKYLGNPSSAAADAERDGTPVAPAAPAATPNSAAANAERDGTPVAPLPTGTVDSNAGELGNQTPSTRMPPTGAAANPMGQDPEQRARAAAAPAAAPAPAASAPAAPAGVPKATRESVSFQNEELSRIVSLVRHR